MQCTLSLSLLLILILSASSFLYGFRNAAALTKGSRTPNNSNNILLMSNSNAATLTKNTKWRLSFSLMCEGYKPVDVLAQIRFINDKGYEPPQGKVFLEEDQNGLIRINNQGYSSVWTLSEDKDDRKDGLWILGLFEEPKYPYLYFSINIFDTIMLPSGDEVKLFDGKNVPEKLDIRFDHKIVNNCVTLTNGMLTYQAKEEINVLGVRVNIGDSYSFGSINISPIND